MDFNSNLKKLRNRLKELNADAIIISMNSTFANIDNQFSDINFISGFPGSNGRAIVSQNQAVLSVDGRYTKQAQEQTDNSIWQIALYPEIDTIKMIIDTLKKGQTLAIGMFSVTYKTYLSITQISKKFAFNLLPLKKHPILDEKQVEHSKVSLKIINEDFMGEPILSRINRIKNTLNNNEAALLADKITIGWAFGIRRTELSNEKSVLANCIAFIPKDGKPMLFCDLKLIEKSDYFDIRSFEEFEDYIKNFPKLTVNLDYQNTPAYFALILENNGFEIKPLAKGYGSFESIKNETEINNQRKGSELTSIAFIKTLAFAENSEKTSEIEVAEFFENKIMEYENAVGLSFNSISSFKESTAIVHYNPSTCGNREIAGDGLFLFDAGAHFNNSTTDMTRTTYRGNNPPEEYRRIYSIVLKSLIMFSSANFPDNSYSACIDTIARFPVWKAGYDYAFGTGHGVGCFGNVHEHPRISQSSTDKITKGMVLTVEPGIYNKEFGIRIENMLLTKTSSENSKFIQFETLNFIPFCVKLIDKNLLDKSEIDWLNDYHNQVLNKFKNELKDDELALNWLKENTKEI